MNYAEMLISLRFKDGSKAFYGNTEEMRWEASK